MTMVENRG